MCHLYVYLYQNLAYKSEANIDENRVNRVFEKTVCNVVASSGKQEHVRKHPVKPVSSLNIIVGLFYDQIPGVKHTISFINLSRNIFHQTLEVFKKKTANIIQNTMCTICVPYLLVMDETKPLQHTRLSRLVSRQIGMSFRAFHGKHIFGQGATGLVTIQTFRRCAGRTSTLWWRGISRF